MAQPNILLIMTDQQRWDTICGRTACRTPDINALADEGITFERSYTPVSLCCPARAMLLSGAYGWHNGVLNQVHVPERTRWGMYDDTITYAMRLRDVGYRTGYVGKWHAHWLKGPLDYGYGRASMPSSYGPAAMQRSNFRPDDLYAYYAQKFPIRLAAERAIRWPGGSTWPVWQEYDGPMEGRHTHAVAERGMHMLREFAEEDRPWLLEIHFPEPHDPFAPHIEFARRYDWRDIPLPPTWHEEFGHKPRMNEREAATYNDLSEEDVRQAVAHYWAYNEEIDYYVGRILKALREIGQADRTLVAFTTDHGEMLGDHHMFIKGWMPYESTHRIPLMMRYPSQVPAKAHAQQLVQLHDLAHTFCDLAGAEPLPFADGVSLTDVLRNPDGAASRDALMNVYYGGEFLYTQRILITRRYKYVFNGFDIDELYDLQTDPHEVVNQVDNPEYAEVADTLRVRLYEMMDTYGDPYALGDLSTGWSLYHAGRYLRNPRVR